MKEITILEHSGSFAENKDIARRIRDDFILPSLRAGDDVVLDFSGIESVTQSFAHALISEAIREFGSPVFDRMVFRGCNDIVKKIILIISEYMQESE